MNNYVLFSPIGTSDPTRLGYDGPMPHIVRHYKPKKVYLFFTKGIFDLHKKDDRYCAFIKTIDKDVEIEIIAREDIEKPNDFKLFDKIYEEILYKIKAENPTSTILANVSSGTPQMLSALYLLAAKIEIPIRLIAVETPRGEANAKVWEYDIKKEIAENWDSCTDEDTKKDVKNRCTEIIPDNIVKMFSQKMIKQYLDIYDYNAALVAYENASEFFNENLENALQGVNYRIKLEYSNAKSSFEKAGIPWGEITSVQTNDISPLFEFILYLQTRQKSGNLMDFARAVSPCLMNLFELILLKILKVDVHDYCSKEKNDILSLKRENLNSKQNYLDSLDKAFPRPFINSPLAPANMLPIIECECILQNKTALYNKCKKLRTFEETIRNPIAHKITSVSEDFIKTTSKSTSEQIIKIIKELFKEIAKYDVAWEDYTIMNQKILKYM